MVRHPRSRPLAALLVLSVLAAGCGIKGPLKPAPADAAKAPADATKPAPREPRTDPKL